MRPALPRRVQYVRPALLGMAFVLGAFFPSFAEEGDPGKGEAIYKACKGCHQVGEGARNGIGPHLDGVFGRKAGSLEGFKYSKAMVKQGVSGMIWNPVTLDAYIAEPQGLVPGTRMSYRGMKKAQDRMDLIAYLKSASLQLPSEETAATASAAAPGLGDAAMKIKGDPAYGEYLATECVTCHQITGQMRGIPSIIGWPKDAFIRAIFEYKTNVRSHDVMKLMTVNLNDEEVAALAAYFAEIEPQ